MAARMSSAPPPPYCCCAMDNPSTNAVTQRTDRHPVFLSGPLDVAPILHSIHCCYHLFVVPAFAFTGLTETENCRSRQAPFLRVNPLGIVRAKHLQIKKEAYDIGSSTYLQGKLDLLTDLALPLGIREEDTTSCSAHAPFTSVN